jgi:hypothetical protein
LSRPPTLDPLKYDPHQGTDAEGERERGREGERERGREGEGVCERKGERENVCVCVYVCMYVCHTHASTCTHFLCALPNEGVCTLKNALRYPFQKIDATDAAMCTPLHCAAWKGHNDVVDVLLEAGANHMALTESGWTPLHTAAFRGHEGVTRALLGAGVDPRQRDLMGYTPFELAESEGIRALLRRAMEEYVVRPRMSSLTRAGGMCVCERKRWSDGWIDRCRCRKIERHRGAQREKEGSGEEGKEVGK